MQIIKRLTQGLFPNKRTYLNRNIIDEADFEIAIDAPEVHYFQTVCKYFMFFGFLDAWLLCIKSNYVFLIENKMNIAPDANIKICIYLGKWSQKRFN